MRERARLHVLDCLLLLVRPIRADKGHLWDPASTHGGTEISLCNAPPQHALTPLTPHRIVTDVSQNSLSPLLTAMCFGRRNAPDHNSGQPRRIALEAA